MTHPSPEDLIDAAEAAEAVDLDKAIRLWSEFRARFPDHVRGFGCGVAALRQRGHLHDAIALGLEGMNRFPDDDWLANEHAWTVFETGDLAAAAAAWAVVRQRFPDDADGYIGGGLTSRRAGDLDDAERIYRAGLERCPEHAMLHVEFARVAEERADLAAAAARWASVLDKFADDPEVLIAHAWSAQDRGDWPEALQRWERALVAFPDRIEPRRFAAQSLLEVGRAREASLVLAPALRLYPEDSDLCVLDAWIATRRGDVEAALSLWRGVRERFPNRSEGYLAAASMLHERRRPDEADALIVDAHGRLALDAEVAVEFARIPERHSDWSLAAARWRDVIGRFPWHVEAHLRLSESLRRLGNRAEAHAVLERCAVLHPQNVEVASAGAVAATVDQDWPEALRLWSVVTDRFPDDPRGYVGHGRALREAGDLEAATGVLRDAHARFPDDVDAAVALAESLSAQRRWPQALETWASLKRRYPSDHRVGVGIMEMLAQALADQQAHGPHAFEIPPILLEPDTARDPAAARTARLLERFESLGSDCEFAMVQRLYRVEHVSLLRWTSMPPDLLIAALNARLEGVGDPEYTCIEVKGDEYTTRDTRYFMHSHTFTSPRAEALESFAPEQCRRIQWLRRRLIESLSTASRIFVYKSKDGISDTQIAGLFEALRRYSPRNLLLCVRLETAQRPSGSVDELAPGLYLGYIDRFSTVDIHVDAWLDICETVARRCA